MRLVASGLSELLRNSPATVEEHYSDSNLLSVKTVAANVRTFPQRDLYLLTGQEKLPLPERTPHLTSATKAFKLNSLAQCGGVLNKSVKHDELLSDEHIVAGFHEMGFRALSHKDLWPNPLILCLNPAELNHWLQQWSQSPGSPVSQKNLQTCRQRLEIFLAKKSEAGFVSVPIGNGAHWTLLLLVRQSPAPNQTEPNKIELIYKDSLTEPSPSCQEHAKLALTFLTEAAGVSEFAQHNLPACSPSFKQTDIHSCGYFCLLFIEEQYRLWRGEGRRALPVNWRQKATDLTKFCSSLMTLHHAELKKEAVAKALAAPPPAPLADAPAAPASSAVVSLPAGPAEPLALQETWGCSRCRHHPQGFLTCNPEKMAKRATKAKTVAPSKAASSTDQWAAFACPPAAKKRKPSASGEH